MLTKYENARPTLLWLRRSFDATSQRGSSAYFSLLRHPKQLGWAAAYPETTGYIIETLLDYHAVFGEKWMLDCVKNAADWILTLQKNNGSLPGGVGENGQPSVFNTGMMLFGLEKIYEKTREEKYLVAAEKSVNWLLSILEKDGSWQQGAFVENHTPSYYTRVVWAVLKVNQHLQRADIQKDMQLALDFYKQKVQPNNSVLDWAFSEKKPAFTHTIAYTQRGFLESGILLKDEKAIEIAKNIALKVNDLLGKNGKIAGEYDENWNGNHRYVCITGNAQLSINAARIYEHLDEKNYLILSQKLFETVIDAPCKIPFAGYRGAIAGSSPIWGNYRYFCYPNWAAKFWLDAFLFYKKYEKKTLSE